MQTSWLFVQRSASQWKRYSVSKSFYLVIRFSVYPAFFPATKPRMKFYARRRTDFRECPRTHGKLFSNHRAIGPLRFFSSNEVPVLLFIRKGTVWQSQIGN